MTSEEFSNQFDVLYNNITSNQAPGLTEYEKSVFLTKAEKEIVLNHFTPNSKGNNIGQGFDDSAKRQADFLMLMKTDKCTLIDEALPVPYNVYECSTQTDSQDVLLEKMSFTQNGEEVLPPELEEQTEVLYGGEAEGYYITVGEDRSAQNYYLVGWPFNSEGTIQVVEREKESDYSKIDDRSSLYTFPSDVFIVINETIKTTDNNKKLSFQVVPLRFDEYTRLMSKPFKRPLKNQAWRLINSGNRGEEGYSKYYTRIVEVITASKYDNNKNLKYTIRYIRRPKPIIIGDLDGLTIDGYIYGEPSSSTTNILCTKGCELDPILHEEILQRAVELAKIAWTATGQDNTQAVMAAGQRSE